MVLAYEITSHSFCPAAADQINHKFHLVSDLILSFIEFSSALFTVAVDHAYYLQLVSFLSIQPGHLIGNCYSAKYKFLQPFQIN